MRVHMYTFPLHHSAFYLSTRISIFPVFVDWSYSKTWHKQVVANVYSDLVLFFFVLFCLAPGMTNPPSRLEDPVEIPYPVPARYIYDNYAAYLLNWAAPDFTGGLPSLHYNISIEYLSTYVRKSVLSADTSSVVGYIEAERAVKICVIVTNPAINSLDRRQHPSVCRRFDGLSSNCLGEGMRKYSCSPWMMQDNYSPIEFGTVWQFSFMIKIHEHSCTTRQSDVGTVLT